MNKIVSQPHVFLCVDCHPDVLTFSNFPPHPMLSAKFYLRRNCEKALQCSVKQLHVFTCLFDATNFEVCEQILKTEKVLK